MAILSAQKQLFSTKYNEKVKPFEKLTYRVQAKVMSQMFKNFFELMPRTKTGTDFYLFFCISSLFLKTCNHSQMKWWEGRPGGAMANVLDSNIAISEYIEYQCCIAVIQLYVYIYMRKQSTILTNEHNSLEKYTSHTLFSKGLQKSCERIMCERWIGDGNRLQYIDHQFLWL